MASLPVVGAAIKFHLSLNVSNLGRSVDFYRILFGVESAKRHDDYAKFELEEPPVVLSLVPRMPGPGGALNHVGIRLSDSMLLVQVQRRLEEHGIATQREEGVECCHSRQTKCWVTDPDCILWEIYTLDEDVDPAGFEDPPVTAAPVPPQVWEHRLTDPWPDRIEHANGALDEVRLEGSFNAGAEPGQLDALLSEVHRVLRPGGGVTLHGLVGDQPCPGTPGLPGPAAIVQRVPVVTEPLSALRRAGFGGLFLEKLGDKHCFQVNGVKVREMQVVGWKTAGASWPTVEVVYKGPFEQVTDEEGTVYRRGERVVVSWAQAERLRLGPAADQFTFVAS
jgi:catechol 2,3-dioxygenase-like lactoylglutathione lyase family enzyme